MKAPKKHPVHPGEILREELTERGLSARAFAEALRVPTNRITAILNGTRAVTADTALRLAKCLGTSAELWMGLQAEYDLIVAAHDAKGELRQIARAS